MPIPMPSQIIKQPRLLSFLNYVRNLTIYKITQKTSPENVASEMAESVLFKPDAERVVTA
jgi:hypothetical protein